MQNVKDAAVAWIAKHIHERFPHEQQIVEMAEALVAIAEHYEVPDESLATWIHLHPRGSELSSEAFRVWAEAYAAERERVLAEAMREEV